MAMDRYEVQVIDSQDDGINYRITDTHDDNRIATSYDVDHANFVVEALNFHNKYHAAIKNGVVIAGVVVE